MQLKLPDYPEFVSRWRREARRGTKSGMFRRVVKPLYSYIFSRRACGHYMASYGICPWARSYSNPRILTSTENVMKAVEYALACSVRRDAREAIVVGVRGSGKSSLQEAASLVTIAEGGAVLDLFGARGGEQLGWMLYVMGVRGKGLSYMRHCFVLESKLCPAILAAYGVVSLEPEDMVYTNLMPPVRLLIVVPDNARVYTTSLIAKFVEKGLVTFAHASELLASDPDTVFREYNVIAIPVDFFSGKDAAPGVWHMVSAVVAWVSETPLTSRVTVLAREAATLVYVRGKLTQEQTMAKNYLARLAREARHANMNLLFDTQRLKGVEANVREVVDSIVLKRVNPVADIGQDVEDVLASVLFGNRDRETAFRLMSDVVSSLENNQFIALTGNCALVGCFAEPPNHCRAGQCKSIPVYVSTGGVESDSLGDMMVKVLDPIDTPIVQLDEQKRKKLTPEEIIEAAREHANPLAS